MQNPQVVKLDGIMQGTPYYREFIISNAEFRQRLVEAQYMHKLLGPLETPLRDIKSLQMCRENFGTLCAAIYNAQSVAKSQQDRIYSFLQKLVNTVVCLTKQQVRLTELISDAFFEQNLQFAYKSVEIIKRCKILRSSESRPSTSATTRDSLQPEKLSAMGNRDMLIRYMGYVQDVAQGLIYIKERLISLGEQEEGMLKLYGSMEPEFDIWDLQNQFLWGALMKGFKDRLEKINSQRTPLELSSDEEGDELNSSFVQMSWSVK